jgi:hypothetical protein
MLSRFSVRNFKSFNDWFVFDLSDVNSYEFNPECIHDGLVNKALVYGHNGVGKSNLGLAIFDIVLHTTDKNKNLSNYANYLNAENSSDMAEFAYLFKFDGEFLKYEYGKRNPDDIVYERVFINDLRVIDYDRRNNTEAMIDLPGTETLNKDISQIRISIVKYIRSNSVLPKSRENLVFEKFFAFVETMLLFWSLEKREYQGYEVGSRDMFEDIFQRGHFDEFIEFIKSAGLDSNIRLIEENGKRKPVFYFGDRTVDFWLNCSTGMHSLTLFYYWLQRVKYENERPSFIFIDEFDAFYHLWLSRIVMQELIAAKSQVVVTTHNTSLMTNDLLRPDCYFLMYKDKINPLSRLTDKELRFAHNIEKMYRAGVFGE